MAVDHAMAVNVVDVRLNGPRAVAVAGLAVVGFAVLGFLTGMWMFGSAGLFVAFLMLSESRIRLTSVTLEHRAAGGERRVLPWHGISRIERWPVGIRVVPKQGRPSMISTLGLRRTESEDLETQIRARVGSAQGGAMGGGTLDQLVVYTGDSSWRRWLRPGLGMAFMMVPSMVGGFLTGPPVLIGGVFGLVGLISAALWLIGRGPDTVRLTASALAFGNEERDQWEVPLDAIVEVEVAQGMLELRLEDDSRRSASLSAWADDVAEAVLVQRIREAVARRRAIDSRPEDRERLDALVGHARTSE